MMVKKEGERKEGRKSFWQRLFRDFVVVVCEF